MKILINGLQSGNQSGTGRYTQELARWLPSLDSEFDFVMAWPADVPRPQSDTFIHEAFVPRKHRGVARLFYDQFGIRADKHRLGASIVHYPATMGSFFDLPNVVVTVHDVAFLRHPEWSRFARALYYKLAIRRTVANASRVIADSQATASDLTTLLGVSESKIDVIPLGVSREFRVLDADETARVREHYQLPEHFFLFVGTLEPRKNVARLVDAWSSIASTCGYDLVLAGRTGWKVGAIEAAIERSNYKERIHRTDYVHPGDLPGLLNAARAFVWPALYEGFGLPPLEAMACGCPVLTSETSSLPEVVGNAALMVQPTDTAAIAHAMQRLADEKDLCEALRTKGFERASRFTWERTATMTLETYRNVLA